MKQMRDFIRALIAYMLRNGLGDGFRGRFVFDHHQRYAIYKQYNVAAARQGGTSTLYSDFHRCMIGIVLWCVPIDITQRIALTVAIDSFFNGSAKNE